MKFNSFDLDFNLMNLILKLDLDIVKQHMSAENEVPSFISSTDTHTDVQT